MITIPDALQALRPGAEWVLRGAEYSGLEWLDTVQTKPTEQEVNDEIAVLEAQAPLDACKAKAKELIANVDWSMMPDVLITNKADFEAYRASLRSLILNPVAEPRWPTEPQPVWS
jgi:hypothetical protein